MSRTNIVLIAVLVALGGMLLFLEKPWAQDRFESSSTRVSKAIFENFDATKAASIEIKQGANEVKLKKAAQGWVIPSLNDFVANENAVSGLLSRVRSMNRNDLVTNDPAQHDRYRVTDAAAPRVKISDADGKVLAEFLQGKPYIDLEQAKQTMRMSDLDGFVRAAGSNEVYRTSSYEALEPVKINDWLPRNLFKFEPTAVQTLTIAGSGIAEPIGLNRMPNGNWEMVETNHSIPANKDSCETLARSIASLYLQDVIGPYRPEDAPKYGFDKPLFIVKFILTGGTTEELIIGKDIEKDPTNPAATDESAYALGGIAKQHVSKVFKSSLLSLKVTKAQLSPPPESKPASAPESGPASKPDPAK